MQGAAEHAGHQRDEPVAGGPASGDRGLGRGERSPATLTALRGPSRGPHHQRQGPQQVRHAGSPGAGGRLRLGFLREPLLHSLFCENRCVVICTIQLRSAV